MNTKPTYAELEQRVKALENQIAKPRLFEEKNVATSMALCNALDDLFALVDTKGVIVYANVALAHRFGRSVDDLKGLNGWS
jgi:PAS domain-containing protein